MTKTMYKHATKRVKILCIQVQISKWGGAKTNKSYFQVTLDFFGFAPSQNLNVAGHLFSGPALSSAQFDVPSYQLIAT